MKTSNPNKNVRAVLLLFFYTMLSVLFTLAVMLDALREWYDDTFDVTFETLLYSAVVPLKGMDGGVFASSIKYAVPAVVLCVVVLAAVILFDTKIMRRLRIVCIVSIKGKHEIHINFKAVYQCMTIILSCLLLVKTISRIDSSIHFTEYMAKVKTQSDTYFYEKYYVPPASCNISVRIPSGKPRNILYIYMESMETTYASKNIGGAQMQNLIPCLTRLANENLSFSNNMALGGLHNTAGTGWTLGSIFSSSTGVPFSFPVEGNSMNELSSFASGITALGDILAKQGYNQEFLCGSDGDFAGRKDFFTQHGNYNVFDYYTAIEKGYINKDYYVWWGFEDSILYKIAQDELLRLAQGGKPFNLTMLTVDTHHIGGYVCSLCGDDFADKTANVVQCADKQLGQFIDWCKEQDFYRDTVIIITGDHPRMDDQLVKGTPYFNRTVYDCFINAYLDGQVTPHNGKGTQKAAQTSVQDEQTVVQDTQDGATDTAQIKTQNRTATTMDLFPTVLYAAGFGIDGDRLGLGTNLFSTRPTLTEELGYDYVDGELMRHSSYYIDNFK